MAFLNVVFLLLKMYPICASTTVTTNTISNCSTNNSCLCHNVRNGVLADCSNLGLHEMPGFANNVISINVSRNLIQHLHGDYDFPEKLQNIDVSFNRINNFSNDPFNSTFNLISLNASNNNIRLDKQTYFKGVFKHLKKLEHLDISNNSDIKESNESFSLDDAFIDLSSLSHLTIDAVKNVEFGEMFNNLTNLVYLKVIGVCVLDVIPQSYFKHFHYLKTLDISSDSNFKNFQNKSGYCQYMLLGIEKGTLRHLKKLQSLDISNNRNLGICGFRNVTHDLPFTNITVLKANYLQCERSSSTTLFISDVAPLLNTSLEELYINGNNFDKAEIRVTENLPKSLRVFSATDNRWVLDQYAYLYLQGLTNLRTIDVSFQNRYQMSHTQYENHCYDFELPTQRCQCDRLPPPLEFSDKLPENDEIKYNESPAEQITSCIPYIYTNYEIVMLPPYTETIYMESARVGYSFIPVYFNSGNVRKLILRNNQLYSFIGPICNATYLEQLDLSGNRATDISYYVFSWLPNLLNLSLADNLLGNSEIFQKDISKRIFENQTNLLYLNMSTNRLSSLRPDIFWNLLSAKEIYLNHNLLIDWKADISHMKNLSILDLSWNQFMYLSSTGMAILESSFSNNVTIDISGNPLQCSCDSWKFINWLFINKNHFKLFYSYTCSYKDYESPINIGDAYTNLDRDCRTYIWIIVVSVCCIIAVLVIICAILVYRYRWKLRYWYHVVKSAYGYHRLTTHDDYQFDAFVSYADNDRHFAKDEMVEHLEKQRGFRLCIHHRDFIAGCSIAENITNAIHNSRKMICVLTEDFMRSDWCKYEFNIANVESTVSRQCQNMIVLLMLKGTHNTNISSDIMLMISEETYIQYPDDEEYTAVFWDRLADSLR